MNLKIKDERLMNELSKLAQQSGFDGFCFSIRPIESLNPLPDIKRLSKLFRNYAARQKHLVYWDDRSKAIREDYYRTVSKIDVESHNNSLGFNLWLGKSHSTKNAERIAYFKEKHGLTCVVNFRVELAGIEGWHGVFNLFSSEEPSKVQSLLSSNESHLAWQLQLYSSHLCQLYMPQLNPIANFECLSEKSFNIIELMADDYNNAQIASTLHLSERGVSYHIDRLKQVFNVRSRTALISKIYRFGLLSR
ncbi:response regulator transcription factor [Ferrimonas lipolytica]|uniref:Response regulator transcription factor n=1 Tax=Ferrimonas lipolytica TaxID=2724191 RepID=A0A6H1UBK3_9GAMM|nr:LuxR C-terminal-related transcriptional regulator [Ferrimonas lipolytica]QIZ76467.1 response regulator transcription factor [Ferrimonas lipolytica]